MTAIVLAGTGARMSDAQRDALSAEFNLPPSRLPAIASVEAPRGPFDSRNRLPVLWEGHHFYKHLPAGLRAGAVRAKLAWPRWGQVSYGSYENQYRRIERGAEYHRPAAILSFSAGAYQVLTSNYARAGYASPDAMLEDYRRGETEQTRSVLRFIAASPKMLEALRTGNYKVFARLYNGPGYRKNRYDVKLAAADRLFRQRGSAAPVEAAPVAPKRPDPAVKEAQELLIALGFPCGPHGADGWMGPATRRAVLRFQQGHPDLANDGLLGPQTIAALEMAGKRKQAEQAAVQGGGVAAGAGAGAAALAVGGGLSWPIIAALVLAGLALAGLLYWRYRRGFAWEIAHLKNINAGKVVEVAPWAVRQMAERSGKLLEAL